MTNGSDTMDYPTTAWSGFYPNIGWRQEQLARVGPFYITNVTQIGSQGYPWEDREIHAHRRDFEGSYSQGVWLH